METAKDILEKHGITEKSTDSYLYEQSFKALAEIADKAWEAGLGVPIIKDCPCPACINNAKRKSTFMKSLFPLKEI